MRVAISAIIWISGIILTILLFFILLLLLLITFPFDKKRVTVNLIGVWWADVLIKLSPRWKLRVSGLENIDKRKAYVIVANHQSLADIFVLYKIPVQFRWLAKAEFFNIPFAGWYLSLGRHIGLSKERAGGIRKAYLEAGMWLKKGISILVFPEGTRSETGEIGSFKSGAFKIAIKEKKPVLPVFISGTKDALPKGSWIFNTRASGKLVVLPPVDTEDLKPRDFTYLRDNVYGMLKSMALPAGVIIFLYSKILLNTCVI